MDEPLPTSLNVLLAIPVILGILGLVAVALHLAEDSRMPSNGKKKTEPPKDPLKDYYEALSWQAIMKNQSRGQPWRDEEADVHTDFMNRFPPEVKGDSIEHLKKLLHEHTPEPEQIEAMRLIKAAKIAAYKEKHGHPDPETHE